MSEAKSLAQIEAVGPYTTEEFMNKFFPTVFLSLEKEETYEYFKKNSYKNDSSEFSKNIKYNIGSSENDFYLKNKANHKLTVIEAITKANRTATSKLTFVNEPFNFKRQERTVNFSTKYGSFYYFQALQMSYAMQDENYDIAQCSFMYKMLGSGVHDREWKTNLEYIANVRDSNVREFMIFYLLKGMDILDIEYLVNQGIFDGHKLIIKDKAVVKDIAEQRIVVKTLGNKYGLNTQLPKVKNSDVRNKMIEIIKPEKVLIKEKINRLEDFSYETLIEDETPESETIIREEIRKVSTGMQESVAKRQEEIINLYHKCLEYYRKSVEYNCEVYNFNMYDLKDMMESDVFASRFDVRKLDLANIEDGKVVYKQKIKNIEDLTDLEINDSEIYVSNTILSIPNKYMEYVSNIVFKIEELINDTLAKINDEAKMLENVHESVEVPTNKIEHKHGIDCVVKNGNYYNFRCYAHLFEIATDFTKVSINVGKYFGLEMADFSDEARFYTKRLEAPKVDGITYKGGRILVSSSAKITPKVLQSKDKFAEADYNTSRINPADFDRIINKPKLTWEDVEKYQFKVRYTRRFCNTKAGGTGSNSIGASNAYLIPGSYTNTQRYAMDNRISKCVIFKHNNRVYVKAIKFNSIRESIEIDIDSNDIEYSRNIVKEISKFVQPNIEMSNKAPGDIKDVTPLIASDAGEELAINYGKTGGIQTIFFVGAFGKDYIGEEYIELTNLRNRLSKQLNSKFGDNGYTGLTHKNYFNENLFDIKKNDGFVKGGKVLKINKTIGNKDEIKYFYDIFDIIYSGILTEDEITFVMNGHSVIEYENLSAYDTFKVKNGEFKRLKGELVIDAVRKHNSVFVETSHTMKGKIGKIASSTSRNETLFLLAKQFTVSQLKEYIDNPNAMYAKFSGFFNECKIKEQMDDHETLSILNRALENIKEGTHLGVGNYEYKTKLYMEDLPTKFAPVKDELILGMIKERVIKTFNGLENYKDERNTVKDYNKRLKVTLSFINRYGLFQFLEDFKAIYNFSFLEQLNKSINDENHLISARNLHKTMITAIQIAQRAEYKARSKNNKEGIEAMKQESLEAKRKNRRDAILKRKEIVENKIKAKARITNKLNDKKINSDIKLVLDLYPKCGAILQGNDKWNKGNDIELTFHQTTILAKALKNLDINVHNRTMAENRIKELGLPMSAIDAVEYISLYKNVFGDIKSIIRRSKIYGLDMDSIFAELFKARFYEEFTTRQLRTIRTFAIQYILHTAKINDQWKLTAFNFNSIIEALDAIFVYRIIDGLNFYKIPFEVGFLKDEVYGYNIIKEIQYHIKYKTEIITYLGEEIKLKLMSYDLLNGENMDYFSFVDKVDYGFMYKDVELVNNKIIKDYLYRDIHMG